MDKRAENLIQNWERIAMNIPDISHSESGAFSTTNARGTKKGLFSFPSGAFTIESEIERSQEIFKVMAIIHDKLPTSLGKYYSSQDSSVDDGVRGCIDWYVGQWLQDTITVKTDGEVRETLPLKAIYVIGGAELCLGSMFRVLSRKLNVPHYALLGQIIDTYLFWELSKFCLDWEQAEKRAAILFGLGYEMAKAENERNIIAGNSRTSEASQQKQEDRQKKIKQASVLADKVIPEIKKKYGKVKFNTLCIQVSEAMGCHPDTARNYLKEAGYNEKVKQF
jgi:hypothetical protein